MKNCIERMKDNHTDEKIASFRVKQKMPYEFKVNYAYARAWEFYNECGRRGLNCHVSVGGLDSITLYLFLKSIGICVPGISVSYLEDRSIQEVHRQLRLTRLLSAIKPDGTHWNKVEIIRQFGFPVLSKETAGKIELLQNPTPDNATVRHAIITGETGDYGGNRTGTRMKMSQKWLNAFAGGENERENVNYRIAPFKVSSKCCYYLKEKPCDDWAKENNSVPYLGLMASEHGRREKSLMMNGCNYFGATTIRSAPFAIFDRQDLLKLALEMDDYYRANIMPDKTLLIPEAKVLDSIIPTIYGTIECKPSGELYTTRAQRTGCSMCGFGIHLEQRPHRFDRLREDNEKEWHFWMYDCCVDEKTGEHYGWGRVLNYIGVPWEDKYIDWSKRQTNLF
nr:MAG TPA: Phosphoadenosine phosphosulfate reductase [Caudoviricetes sp.]